MDRKSLYYDKRVLEFLAVAVEYGRSMEAISRVNKQDLIKQLTKLLPLLYLKAALLPEETENDEEIDPGQFVTEEEYENLRLTLADMLAPDDVYLDVFVEEMKYSESPISCTLSEGLADIYQDIKNFVEIYRLEQEEMMGEALFRVTDSFKTYWGQTLVNIMRPLHTLCYNANEPDENEEEF